MSRFLASGRLEQLKGIAGSVISEVLQGQSESSASGQEVQVKELKEIEKEVEKFSTAVQAIQSLFEYAEKELNYRDANVRASVDKLKDASRNITILLAYHSAGDNVKRDKTFVEWLKTDGKRILDKAVKKIDMAKQGRKV